MTTLVHPLADGTSLQWKAGSWFDPVEQRYVDPDRLPGSLTVPGSEPPEIVRTISPAGSARPAARKSRQSAAGGTTGERFQTVNAFVDEIARHLTPLEATVWLVLWRRADARSNVAEISMEAIGEKIGRSDRAVQRAVEWLTRCGLIERLTRGTRQTGASRYRLEPRPQSRLSVVEQASARRAGSKKPRPIRSLQPANRDRLGKFST